MRAALGDALDATRAQEVRAAARALLRTPLLRPSGTRREAEAFALVRRHERDLREWFSQYTGWWLVVTPEVARLLVVPPDPRDASHPLREAAGARRPFTRRRYVLLCLCLAALERSDTQIALGRLAEQVVLLAADPQLDAVGLAFRLEQRDERLDLVAAVRVLLGWGALTRVAGAEDSFVGGEGDVLYDVERRVLALLLVGQLPTDEPEQHAGPAAGTVLSEETRTRALRHSLTRKLLCLPVVHHADLSEEESAYLTSQRSALTRRVSELTGLVAEVRAEGIAMVDPDDDLTDLRMPESGTDGHVALLVAEHLATRDAKHPGRPVPLVDLHRLVRKLAQQHAGDWRRGTREPGAEVELVAAAVDRLAALSLVRRSAASSSPGDQDDDGVVVLPALHRYAVVPATRATSGSKTSTKRSSGSNA
ncbi:MAG: TIGR02678 family protein [Quadrisphaera sp.]